MSNTTNTVQSFIEISKIIDASLQTTEITIHDFCQK